MGGDLGAMEHRARLEPGRATREHSIEAARTKLPRGQVALLTPDEIALVGYAVCR
jgi:hypothetical protein